MAKKEANFDLYIHQLLCEAGIKADTQGSNNVEIDNALKKQLLNIKQEKLDILNMLQLYRIL